MCRAPDDQPIKAKMLQSTSLKEMQKDLEGLYLKLQCSEVGEISEKDVVDQVVKAARR